jgi:hypothetical protein
MTPPTILREELVEQSVMRAITTGLPDYNYTLLALDRSNFGAANVLVREEFPTPDERNGELDITTLAFGFNVDDGGRPMELGSNLTEYTHSLTTWVFGLDPQFARRLAFAVKHIMRRNSDVLPLYDFNQDGDPQIDALIVEKVQTKHEANNSPRPWDRYVFTVVTTIQDVFYPT